jgi:hypothetical protein
VPGIEEVGPAGLLGQHRKGILEAIDTPAGHPDSAAHQPGQLQARAQDLAGEAQPAARQLERAVGLIAPQPNRSMPGMEELQAPDHAAERPVPKLVLAVDVGGDAAAHGDSRVTRLDGQEPAEGRRQLEDPPERRARLAVQQARLRVEGEDAVERAGVLDETPSPEAGGRVRIPTALHDTGLIRGQGLEVAVTVGPQQPLAKARASVEADHVGDDRRAHLCSGFTALTNVWAPNSHCAGRRRR